MKWTAAWLVLAALVPQILSAALARRQLAEIDLTVLQFALTVSHEIW